MLGSHLLAQSADGSAPTGGAMDLVVPLTLLAVVLLTIAGMWRVFAKAGRPGWGVLVPVYNMYLMCRVAGYPGWWLILMLLPVVNIVITVMVSIGLARNFGKGAGYAVGLLLLPFPFYPMLGFGRAQYLAGGADDDGGAGAPSGHEQRAARRAKADDDAEDEEAVEVSAPKTGRPL